MKKMKWSISITMLGILLLLIYTSQAGLQKLNAKDAAMPFTDPQFNLGDSLYYGDHEFQVIDNGSVIKLLSKTPKDQVKSSYSEMLDFFGNSGAAIQRLHYGTLGYEGIKGTVKAPSTSDLSNIINASTIHTLEPFSDDWWLGDDAQDGFRKFASSTNTLDKPFNYKIQDTSNTSTCTEETVTKQGVMPENDLSSTGHKTLQFDPNSAVVRKYQVSAVKSATAKQKLPNNNFLRIDLNRAPNGASTTSGGVMYGSTFTDNQIINATTPKYAINATGVNFSFGKIISDAMAEGKIPLNRTFKTGDLISFKTSDNLQQDYVVKIMLCEGTAVSNLKNCNSGSNVTGTTFQFVSFGDLICAPGTTCKTTNQNCPAVNTAKGTALIRPMISLNRSDIALINTAKRTYNADHQWKDVPQSDGGAYITMKTSKLDVQLDAAKNGVSGSVYTTKKPADGILQIPVKVSGTVEGTQYISAVANINGIEKYRLLKQTSNGNDTIQIDLNDFTDDLTAFSELNITLYHENSGDYQTSYMSNGTDITVHFLQPQVIAFDAGQSTAMTYGSDLRLTASLTTSSQSQSDAKILYTVKSGNASIIDQDYVNGTAYAMIHPTSGTGDVVIAINKAGDSYYADAEEQTFTISLQKKAITINPAKPNKIYKVGEPMFTMASSSNGLVNGDTIPNTLVPKLVNQDGSALQPDENGIVKHAGTWKIKYDASSTTGITSFMNKYAVTLIDYDDDPSYIFEAILNEVPSGWVKVSPDANADGWNTTPVTIAPDRTAISAGYTIVEAVDEHGIVLKSGTSITYDQDITSIIPKVRLKKGDATTDASPIRELKIDSTRPTASVQVDRATEWVAGTKKVTITAADLTSGIQSVTAACGGKTFSAALNQGVYVFQADTNGDYTITVKDHAGNEAVLHQAIEKIDMSAPMLNAVKEVLSADAPKQKITLTWNAGDAGIKTFKVYHKVQSSDTYSFLADLTSLSNPYEYFAEMNGYFYFELITNAGITKDAEVEITQVNPPVPVTKIDAVYHSDLTKIYTSNTWTNQDILLTLSNAAVDVQGTITWEVSEDQGATWTSMGTDTALIVSTSDTLQKTYMFRATAVAAQTVSEISPKSITVKIDKTKPATPTVKNQDHYTTSTWYSSSLTLEGEVADKANLTGIKQELYVCEGTKSACEGIGAAWIKTINGAYTVAANGRHEVYFKAVDEAGNESELSEAVYANINNTQPVIHISLNDDKIRDLLNSLTFGFFFNDTIKIDIEAEYGFDTGGEIHYIIDEDADESTPFPQDDDTRWIKGTGEHMVQDAKAMIYVKAKSNAGVVAHDSSVYNVYLDRVAPIITFPDTSEWTNNTALHVDITDDRAGINPNKVYYNANGNGLTKGAYANQTLTISSLMDGTYRLDVEAEDYSQNTGNNFTMVRIDTVKPVIGPIHPTYTSWTNTQLITFDANDALSGLDPAYPKVTDADDRQIPIQKNLSGSYECILDRNGSYTITVKDLAGNEQQITYTETNIDEEPPVISNISIEHAAVWKTSKKVTFDVTDTMSGVDHVEVHYTDQGVEKNVLVNSPVNGSVYSFTANQDAVYTIIAYDRAGNSSNETVEVENIDPNGLKIVNISNIDQWHKDRMNVTFEIQSGASGIQTGYPKVTVQGNDVNVQASGSIYSFEALLNDVYTIEAKNEAGELVSETVAIQKIDTMKPVIEDISDNASSTSWRNDVDVDFHVYDYNNANQTQLGSGLMNGYPKVYYLDGGVRIDVPVTKDGSDQNKFIFHADRNASYYIEVMDAVGHDPVIEEIVVDHILDQTMISPIQIAAENNGVQIAEGTWVSGDIVFTIQGGLDTSVLEKYQYAVTNSKSVQPQDSDFHDLNMSNTNQHHITGNDAGRYYWFRALPMNAQMQISKPFLLNLDSAKPTSMSITLAPKISTTFDLFMNAVTFGLWSSDEQIVTLQAVDNYTSSNELRYEYAEEVDGVLGAWMPYSGNLSYQDTDCILHARAIDLAGNVSDAATTPLQIDTQPPIITGVQDQKEYKQYYLPRFVTVSDLPGSGLVNATLTKDGLQIDTFQDGIEKGIHEEGTYAIYAVDEAGNEVTMSFKLVKLPDIDTEIDGSDESKAIIDQIQREYDEIKDKIDLTEKEDIQEWLDEANKKWEDSRTKVIIDVETTSKVEGQGDTSFDPNTELIVDEVDKDNVPDLPRKAINVYDVYMMKGDQPIQPNGSVKVYLPYEGNEPPIVYEIDDDGTVKEITAASEDGYVTLTTNVLKKYAISNAKQDINQPDDNGPKNDTCVVGPDGIAGTQDDVCGSDDSAKKPDGSVEVPPNGDITFPNGDKIDTPDGGLIHPDGSVTLPDGSEYDKDGNKKEPSEKPKQCPAHINKDTDHDGKPDINIDLNGDCEADINLDTNGDDVPDINIDTKGDGKPHYNIDTNNDGKADLNIGPLPSPWKPNVCVSVQRIAYCTMKDLIPEVNIDTDNDGKADINVDTNGDGKPDINIDIDGDSKPDLNIDTNGDGKPDRNIDANGNGIIDDEEQGSNVGNDGNDTQKTTTTTKGTYHQNAIGGASTGDTTNIIALLTMLILSIGTGLWSMHGRKPS